MPPLSHIHRHEFFQSADERRHVVGLAQIQLQHDTLIVVGGDDEVLVAVDAVAHFLGLMSGDENGRTDLLGKLGHADGCGVGCASVVEAIGGPTWPNLVEAAWRSCGRLGISQSAWGRACQQFGREQAAESGKSRSFSQSSGQRIRLRRNRSG